MQVFRQTGPPQQVTAWLNLWEMSVKCLSQGHNEAIVFRLKQLQFLTRLEKEILVK